MALVYPNNSKEITQGNYLKPTLNQIKSELDKIKECAVILIATEKTISNWQKSIFEGIYHWMTPSVYS